MDFLIRESANNPDIYGLLMDIALNSTHKKSWRAAWMADKIHDQYPERILPFMESMILKLTDEKNNSKKRHFLKLISQHPVPEKHTGFLVGF